MDRAQILRSPECGSELPQYERRQPTVRYIDVQDFWTALDKSRQVVDRLLSVLVKFRWHNHLVLFVVFRPFACALEKLNM